MTVAPEEAAGPVRSGLRIPRRAVLVGLGLSAGTLVLGLSRWARTAGAGAGAGAGAAQPAATGWQANAFIHVGADGTVTIVSHRSEMGQGTRSTLPALIADELGAAIDRVRVVQADGDAKYGDQTTDGSQSIPSHHEAMRRVGAAARTMLIGAAAARWGVAASACTAIDHAVVHTASRRRLGFGELAAAAARQPVPALDRVALRPWSELRRIGGPLPHIDAPDIVAGRAVYGADVALPGMLIAVVARPPAVGDSVARYDAGPARAVPGVRRVVELPVPTGALAAQPLGGLAVVADTTWAALRGRAALDIAWRDGPHAAIDSAGYRAQLLATVRAPATPVRRRGDVDAALARSARRITAEYTTPHLAHVPMEPPAAVARVDADRCELWTSTQDPQGVQAAVGKALGIDPHRVTVHVTLLGCGFGRKSFADYAVEAALVARAAGAPVRVQWTRDDDVRHGYYLPATAQRFEAGLDAAGRIVAWLHRTTFTTTELMFDLAKRSAQDWELAEGVTETPLDVPAVRCEYGEAALPTRVGWLRGVHNNAHAFGFNSFADEIARARGVDPRDVLRALLGPRRRWTAQDLGVPRLIDERFAIDTGRYQAVLDRVCALSRWTELRAAGRAVGLAVHRTERSYAAWVVALAVAPEATGAPFRVDEAWGVIDAGRILNPDRVRAQMEGSFAFGLSLALYGGITLRRGATEQSNFHDHRIARLHELPRALHIDLVASEERPGGVGEVGVPPVAPAIANALASLTGARVRDLPLLPRGGV
jgi:isoquinoline 1-oxidoreductase subunit beta